MGKLIERPKTSKAAGRRKLAQLRKERQKLAARLSRLENDISKLAAEIDLQSSDAAFERWLDEMREGMPDLPSLPADFSRADIYHDHN